MKHILVVDDDAYIRDLYGEILQSAGYTVTYAVDGKEAFDSMRKGGFDLILLDVMLPQMNALAVLKALEKQPPVRPNGPIILLTNLAQDPTITELMRLGASAYVIKVDLTPDQVISKVKEMLKK
jgi:CheY-like chemotaxis protein